MLGTGEVPEIVEAIGGTAHRRRRAADVLSHRASRRIRPIADRAPAPGTRCRPTSTTPTRRACWRRRGITPTSRSPRAATTSARSASSRRCAARIAAAPPTRSCARRATLAARGVKELLLISQDTTFYGIDRRERGALARLLRALNAVDGLEWIRLLYLYPTTIDDETLAAMAECDKVCKYIDLPLQHASNAVLQAHEAARARVEGYDRLLERIRARVPGRRPARAGALHALQDRIRRVLQRQVDVVADLVALGHRRQRRRRQSSSGRDRGAESTRGRRPRSARAAGARARRARGGRCRRRSCPAR